MKISPVNSNYYSGLKMHAQTNRGHADSASFKGKYKATADDSMISWGVIAGIAVAAFAVATVTVVGVKKSLQSIRMYAQEFENRIGELGKRVNATAKTASTAARRSIPPKGVLEIDAERLRTLPEQVRRQAKDALNNATSNEQYQKVIRDFRIWK